MNILYVYILLELIALLFLSIYLTSKKEKKELYDAITNTNSVIRGESEFLSEKLSDISTAIREEIRFAIEPKIVDAPQANDLIELAVDVWRLEQRLSKCISDIPENKITGLQNALEKLRKFLSKVDIEVVDYTGQKFNDGLNLDVLSVVKEPGLHQAIIKETVEPTVMCRGSVLKKAKIILCTA